MSFLWMGTQKNNKKNHSKKYASSPNDKVLRKTKMFSFIERIFSFSSCHKGSMTVEASIVLPIFLFFFLYLVGIMQLIHYQGLIKFSLWNAGNKLAVYEVAGDVSGLHIPDTVTAYTLVRGEVVSLIGKKNLEEAPLKHGINSINFLETEIEKEKGIISLVATYEVNPTFSLFPFPYTRMKTVYYGKAWNGYEVEKQITSSQQKVYVTEYGAVWHTSLACSYLHISVEEVSVTEISKRRNSEEKKYKACSFCYESSSDILYITPDGDCYHSDLNCRGLVRNIKEISLEDTGEYRPCSKCGSR